MNTSAAEEEQQRLRAIQRWFGLGLILLWLITLAFTFRSGKLSPRNIAVVGSQLLAAITFLVTPWALRAFLAVAVAVLTAYVIFWT